MPLCTYYKWLKSKKLTIPNADKDVKQQELSFIDGGNAKWYTHCEGWFLIELRIVLLCDPAITLLGIYPNKWKTYAPKNLHMAVNSNVIHNFSKLEVA